MKSKHSGMLRHTNRGVENTIYRWNLNTVECWGCRRKTHDGRKIRWNLNTVECWGLLDNSIVLVRLWWNLNTVECWGISVGQTMVYNSDEI